MKLPTLYKKTSTGALQEWTIEVDGDMTLTHFGQTGGEIQESVPTRHVGKNIGRANATTPEQQALAEAKSQWEKKLKKDYTQDKNCKSGQKSELIEGGILPMLAHKFSEHGEKLKYPCFVQRKYDGARCIAVIDAGGKCRLWSRTRKPITGVPHIIAELEKAGLRSVILDGELWCATEPFETLMHFIRQTEPEPGHEVLEYHVYDLAGPGTFRERCRKLQTLLA